MRNTISKSIIKRAPVAIDKGVKKSTLLVKAVHDQLQAGVSQSEAQYPGLLPLMYNILEVQYQTTLE